MKYGSWNRKAEISVTTNIKHFYFLNSFSESVKKKSIIRKLFSKWILCRQNIFMISLKMLNLKDLLSNLFAGNVFIIIQSDNVYELKCSMQLCCTIVHHIYIFYLRKFKSFIFLKVKTKKILKDSKEKFNSFCFLFFLLTVFF